MTEFIDNQDEAHREFQKKLDDEEYKIFTKDMRWNSFVDVFRSSKFNKSNHKQLSLLEELENLKKRRDLKYNEALALTMAIKQLKDDRE